jgi:hypothetical protein
MKKKKPSRREIGISGRWGNGSVLEVEGKQHLINGHK